MLKKQLIQFTNINEWLEETIPTPATKIIPEWYRKMPTRHNNDFSNANSITIKKCLPVFDALTAGYILSTPCDIYVKQEDGEPSYLPTMDILSAHPAKQLFMNPNGNMFKVPKLMNGWGIKTPKGYSTLFIPPMHNPNPWFEVLPGIVDTDILTEPVNFPFMLKDKKFEGLIPCGTPFIQIIPFKRDVWKVAVGGPQDKLETIEENKKITRYAWDRYKKLGRVVKQWNSQE